jgi:hypothetical protein
VKEKHLFIDWKDEDLLLSQFFDGNLILTVIKIISHISILEIN